MLSSKRPTNALYTINRTVVNSKLSNIKLRIGCFELGTGRLGTKGSALFCHLYDLLFQAGPKRTMVTVMSSDWGAVPTYSRMLARIFRTTSSAVWLEQACRRESSRAS